MNIAFDYDGTLDDDFDDTFNPVKEKIQGIAREHIKNGDNVCIMTRRYDYNKQLGLENESLKVFYKAKELGIEKVYFTNRDYKYNYVIMLGIEKIYENSQYEIDLIDIACEDKGHVCETININDYE